MYDLLLIPRPLALAAGARFLAAGVNVERDAAVGSPTVPESARNIPWKFFRFEVEKSKRSVAWNTTAIFACWIETLESTIRSILYKLAVGDTASILGHTHNSKEYFLHYARALRVCVYRKVKGRSQQP